MVYDIYVSIMVIYHLFIEYGLSGINSQHSMLALRKDSSIFIYKNTNNILPTTLL